MRRMSLATAFFVSACASVGGMRGEPLHVGVQRNFNSDIRSAVVASRNACMGSQLEIEEVTKVSDGTWYIIAKRSRAGWTWGELVRIVIEEAGEGEVAIRIFTRRRMDANIAAKGDWSEELFGQIALELERASP